MPELKGIMFDLQGTLCLGDKHTRNLIMRPGTREELESLHSAGMSLSIVSGHSEEDALDLVARLGLGEVFEPYVVLGKGSVRTVEELRETEVKKGWLGKIGVREVVKQSALVRRELETKPAPDQINHFLRDWGIDPSEAVFAGDSPADQTAALRARVPFADVDRISFHDNFSNVIDSVIQAHTAPQTPLS